MQLCFQFIPNVFSGVEARTLEFFHTNHGKLCVYETLFVHKGIIMMKKGVGLLKPVNEI